MIINKINRNRNMNFFSKVVVFLPIISVYGSGIPGFSAGDLILLIVSTFYFINFLFNNNGVINVNRTVSPMLYFIVTIIITSLFDILIVDNISFTNIFIRVIRRVFYYLVVVLISSVSFQYNNASNLIIKVGIFSALYLMLQYILYYGTNFVLTGYIPFLPLYHDYYSSINYNNLYQIMYRPTSILLEPAHASRYMCIPLTILLFEDRWRINKRLFMAITISIAIVMTTSGTGIIYVAVLWLSFILSNIWKSIYSGNIKPIYSIGIISFILSIPIIIKNPIVENTIFRIINSDLTNVSTAGGARFRGYIQYFKLPFINLITGMGYGSTPDTELVTWFSGASYILYGCGIIGFLACVYCFIVIFLRIKNMTGRMLLIIWVLMFFMDDSFMSHIAVTYFSFICLSKDYNIHNKKWSDYENTIHG